MADILLTTLSEALMKVAKTAPLKARTKSEADKTAKAIMAAMPDRAAMRAGLLLGETEKALAAKAPEQYEEGFSWLLEGDAAGAYYSASGYTLGTAASALLSDITAD